MRKFNYLLLFFFVAMAFSKAQTGYQMPPKAIADLIDAPPTPGVSLSPDNSKMLILERAGLQSIKELGEEELRLAGLRLNPRTAWETRMLC